MALYRALSNLGLGRETIRKGEVFAEGAIKAEALERLIKLGRVSRCATPPLSVLPRWEKRAAKLRPFGVISVEEFMRCPDEELATALGTDADEVAAWKREALRWLDSPDQRER